VKFVAAFLPISSPDQRCLIKQGRDSRRRGPADGRGLLAVIGSEPRFDAPQQRIALLRKPRES
jgi:hypothetical protein